MDEFIQNKKMIYNFRSKKLKMVVNDNLTDNVNLVVWEDRYFSNSSDVEFDLKVCDIFCYLKVIVSLIFDAWNIYLSFQIFHV